jgi:magnesium-transporting ATPase (P-type)
MLGIFYILQYITCAIYILENFIFFGVTLISVSFISTIINYFLLRSSYLKIKELAEHYTTVRVVRGGQITEVSSIALVPGDIFQPEGKIQCDCVLVQG